MAEKTVYNQASKVNADEGAVAVDGPDQVQVELTPEAAEETADRLIEEAVMARGQRRLSKLPHKAERRSRKEAKAGA